jgi:L-ascorbate metabolism protein UlaG (beta-lactamase superfamily)
MLISWLGGNYFKLQSNEHSLIFNPYSLDKVTKVAKAKADIVLFTDPSKLAQAKVEETAFVIASPGEYELKDIFIYGYELQGKIVYEVTMEDIKIIFLGEFDHQELENGDLELVEGADILILPVGGGDLTTAKEASRLINKIEPRIVIPSCYAISGSKFKADKIDVFKKEFGVSAEEVDKFRIKKKDLITEDVKLIILKPKE